MQVQWRPDLSDTSVMLALEARDAPYFNIIQYCQHLGLHVRGDAKAYWVARIRTKSGAYRQKRLCLAIASGKPKASFETAIKLAEAWFRRPEISKLASEPYPLGSKRTLNICPISNVYSVGHALKDYLDWKMLAATKSHFETLVSLTNYHLVPRLAHIPLDEFSGRHFNKFAQDVLSTPPKYGREVPTERHNIKHLSQSQLRKRKKTFNALVSILRGAFDIAWEHGKLDNDRPARCLRRLPNVDRPRVVFLDQIECNNLLEASDPDLRELVQAALFTGCRANELTSLLVRDFSAKGRFIFVSSPKGRRTRHVFLPERAVGFFSRLSKDKTGSERLFRKLNGRVWGAEYKTYFQRARERAKLPKSVTFHGLRHTYASKLLEAGASLLTVADQLGHANTQTVSATYGHLTARRRLEEIEACFSLNENWLVEESLSAPAFKHNSDSSWPRANHAKYSGPLLTQLKPIQAG